MTWRGSDRADLRLAKIAEDRASIVDLVGEGHQQSFLVDRIEVFEVGLAVRGLEPGN